MGFARPTDHDFWAGVPGLAGHLLEERGTVKGYLYLSDAGAVGPAAVGAADDVPSVLATAARLARAAARQTSMSGSPVRPGPRSGGSSATDFA